MGSSYPKKVFWSKKKGVEKIIKKFAK